jgi:hypothetical protein
MNIVMERDLIALQGLGSDRVGGKTLQGHGCPLLLWQRVD